MPTIQEVQNELIEEFAFFDDWMDRYRYIIDLGRQLPEFPADKQTDAYKVRGCQSQVWFVAEPMDDGRLRFLATSDAHIGFFPMAETTSTSPAVVLPEAVLASADGRTLARS